MPCRMKLRVMQKRLSGIMLRHMHQYRPANEGWGGGYVLVNVEQEPMHGILGDGPKADPKDPIPHRLQPQLPGRKYCSIYHGRQPHHGHDPPRRQTQRLQEIAEQRRRCSSPVMAWPVHLLQVEVLAEAAVEDLHEQRPVQIQELVLLVVLRVIRFAGQILGRAHAGIHAWSDTVA